jgi:DNA polymerase III subunit epsilon
MRELRFPSTLETEAYICFTQASMEILYLVIIAGLGVIIFRAIVRSRQPRSAKREQSEGPAPAALVRSIEVRESLPTKVQVTPETGLAAFIDVETTGLSQRTDEVIEFAVDLFTFNRETGEILGVVDSYCGLREPSVPISPQASAVCRITAGMVRGKRLEVTRITSILSRAEFALAHNATFDRSFVVRLFPEFAQCDWFCSMRHVDWYSEGCEGRSLGYLLQRFGVANATAHRAGADNAATLSLLNLRGLDGHPFMRQIIQAKANGASIKPSAEKPRTAAARYRRTDWETRTSVVRTGGVSIQFTSTTIKKRDPRPAVADLMDILKGIVSDGVITEEEARDLDRWLTRNGDLTHVWPMNALAAKLGTIMADGIIEQSELDDLREAVLQIRHPESLARLDLAKVTGVPFTQPPPRVVFQGRTFVFTGRFLFGTRAKCEQAVSERGGICKPDVSRTTAYVVVGTLKSDEWVRSSHGRKIEKLIENVRSGCHGAVISEEHWAEAVAQEASALSARAVAHPQPGPPSQL